MRVKLKKRKMNIYQFGVCKKPRKMFQILHFRCSGHFLSIFGGTYQGRFDWIARFLRNNHGFEEMKVLFQCACVVVVDNVVGAVNGNVANAIVKCAPTKLFLNCSVGIFNFFAQPSTVLCVINQVLKKNAGYYLKQYCHENYSSTSLPLANNWRAKTALWPFEPCVLFQPLCSLTWGNHELKWSMFVFVFR